ncbi:hypothetical protein C5167_051082, partial [Papaver somniferum]
MLSKATGATLGKGFNRALATFLAGALGFGAHHLVTLDGDKGNPSTLWLFIFLLATVASFVRFFPGVKARYDYGVSMFILTFCLASVSGYQEDEILKLSHKRKSKQISYKGDTDMSWLHGYRSVLNSMTAEEAM